MIEAEHKSKVKLTTHTLYLTLHYNDIIMRAMESQNHQPNDCLLNHLFRLRWKKTSKFCITELCAGNSPVTGEFPTQRASNTENGSIWWHHHARESYGVSIMSMLEKIDQLISAPHDSRILIIVYMVHPKKCRQHFQIHFLQQKTLQFHWNVCPQRSKPINNSLANMEQWFSIHHCNDWGRT